MAYVPTTGNGSALSAQNRANLMTGNGLIPWLTANGIATSQGYIGEMGIPGSSNPRVDPNYDPGFTLTLQQMYLDFNANNMPVTIWATGEWRVDLEAYLNVDGSNKPINYRSTVSEVIEKNLTGLHNVTAPRGVNLFGADASDGGPNGALYAGQAPYQFYWAGQDTWTAFGSRGITFVRLPFRAERALNADGSLNTTYMSNMRQQIVWAKANGITVNVDMHNYGRFNTNPVSYSDTSGVVTLGQNMPTSFGGGTVASFLTNGWVSIVNYLKSNTNVVWGLMNEMHDLPNGVSDMQSWHRTTVEAIRAIDQTHKISVGGYVYSGIAAWATNNGATAWLTELIPAGQTGAGTARNTDPLILWEGHMYFDYDGTYSGTGSSFASLNQNAINAGYAAYNNAQTPETLNITSQTGLRSNFTSNLTSAGDFSGTYDSVVQGTNTVTFTPSGLSVVATGTSDQGGVNKSITSAVSRIVQFNLNIDTNASINGAGAFVSFAKDDNSTAFFQFAISNSGSGYLAGLRLNVAPYTFINANNTVLSKGTTHTIKIVVDNANVSLYLDGSTTAEAVLTNIGSASTNIGGFALGKYYATNIVGTLLYSALSVGSNVTYDAPPSGGLFTYTSVTTTTTSTSTTTTTTAASSSTTTTTTSSQSSTIPNNAVFRDNGTASNWLIPTGQTGVTFGGNNGFTGTLGQSPSVHIVYTGGNYAVQAAETAYGSAATIFQFFHRAAAGATIGTGTTLFSVYTSSTYDNTTIPLRLDLTPITGSTTTYHYSFIDPSNSYTQTVGTTAFTLGQSVRLVIVQTGAGWNLYINDNNTPELTYAKTQATVGYQYAAVGSNAQSATGGFSGVMDFGEFWFGNMLATPTTDAGRALDIYLGYKQNHLSLSGYIYKNSADGSNLSGTPSIDGVSEDVGYFEQLAVQSNDQAAFILADNWVINNMLRSKSTTANTQNNAGPTTALNLMAFHFNSANTDGKGIATIYDANFATDADNDRMLALFWAHARWGSSTYSIGSTSELSTPNYLQRALNVASDLRQYAFTNSSATGYNYEWNDALQSGTKIQIGGDYANPVAFKMAAQYDTTNATFWNNAVLGTYDAWTKAANVIFSGITPAQTVTAKLNPDWFEFTPSTGAVSTTASTYGDTDYGYNAFRLYPRLHDAYNFYADTAAKTVLALPATTFSNVWTANGYIPATMKHDGTVTGTYEKAYFTWNAVYSLNAAGNTTLASTITTSKLANRYLQKPYGSIYNQTPDTTVSYDYYGQSWGLSEFMRQIGLWVNYGSSYVSPTSTTTTSTAAPTTTTTTTTPTTTTTTSTTTTTTTAAPSTTTTTTVSGYRPVSAFSITSTDKTYHQTFTSLSTVNVPHNLGKYPSVTVVDSSGAECVGTVVHTDANNLTITFSASFSGAVNCN